MNTNTIKVADVEEELFVLYYEEKPLHLVETRIYGWKPTKKVYWTRRAAKCGITNLPNFIDKSKVTIKPYGPKEE